MNIPILFWVGGECVLSLDHCAIHPSKGDRVRIETGKAYAHGYYEVTELVWSFRQILGSEGRVTDDNRLEVHLKKTR